ncbi:hypothetical protein IQ270_24625 [Microcoleus sp. LEGE 07076]|uniref:hypothetical protein n=1 Tax=Microcoleus sp. LEGE 07076 TaxID=915322 RepID=UPI001882B170|nr:hypothetical protein [Microcoleus sp. LEGE 07076]MBE9187743.1 hypothetical protein [Microcoleus sp. LEGE 07076]
MLLNPGTHFKNSAFLAAIATIATLPVLAETANFGTLNLSRGFLPATAILRGSTGGSYSLSAIANADRHKNKCLGFATPTPDHIITLQQNFSKLTIQVNSGGQDTTLLVQGLGNGVRCGDDTGQNKDASIVDTDWQAGSYRIWVGTLEPGVKSNYTISVQE